MRRSSLAAIAIAALLSGCEMIGIESPEKVAAAREADGKAIGGELPTGAQAGLGARLLTGSYYGNTVQIWSALVMAALLGVLLTAAVALAERAFVAGGRKP